MEKTEYCNPCYYYFDKKSKYICEKCVNCSEFEPEDKDLDPCEGCIYYNTDLEEEPCVNCEDNSEYCEDFLDAFDNYPEPKKSSNLNGFVTKLLCSKCKNELNFTVDSINGNSEVIVFVESCKCKNNS